MTATSVMAGILAVGLLATRGDAATNAADRVGKATGEKRTARLAGGASSVDELIDKFAAALRTKDKEKLRSLRVSQDEYLKVILPGSIDEGAPRPRYTQEEQEYFWGLLNGKSVYVEANLMSSWGGRDIKVTAHDFRRGTKKYADYTAYKQLILKFKDGEGNEDAMKIGSIAELDGRFKFISYVRD